MKFMFSTYNARFLTLQVILLTGLTVLYFDGTLIKPFQGEAAVFSGFVALVALWGLLAVWRRRTAHAAWISEKLIRIAIIGMQIGILSAMTAMAAKLLVGADVLQVTGLFLGSMSVGLYVSILAMISNLWLEFTMHVLDWNPDDE